MKGKFKIALLIAITLAGSSVFILNAKSNQAKICDLETVNLTIDAKEQTGFLYDETATSLVDAYKNENWVQLDQNEAYNDGFRQNVDKALNITPITDGNINGKTGCLYVTKSSDNTEVRNGNTSFYDGLRNEVFCNKYLKDKNTLKEIALLSNKIYSNEGTDSMQSFYASLDAYYSLFDNGNQQNKTSNMDKALTRADFNSFLYKAINPVNHDLVPSELALSKLTSTIFNSNSPQLAWGTNKEIDNASFLSLQNGGLTADAFGAYITQSEAVYTIINLLFPDELSTVEKVDLADTISKVKIPVNGGDMLTENNRGYLYELKKDDSKKTVVKYVVDNWQLGVLEATIGNDFKDRSKLNEDTFNTNNKSDKVHEDVYKAIILAIDKKIITPDKANNYAKGVTAYDAIDMFIRASLAKNKSSGFITNNEYGKNTHSKSESISNPVPSGPISLEDKEEVPDEEEEVPVDSEVDTGVRDEQIKYYRDKLIEQGVSDDTIKVFDFSMETNAVSPKRSYEMVTKIDKEKKAKQQADQQTKQQADQQTKQQADQQADQQANPYAGMTESEADAEWCRRMGIQNSGNGGTAADYIDYEAEGWALR